MEILISEARCGTPGQLANCGRQGNFCGSSSLLSQLENSRRLDATRDAAHATEEPTPSNLLFYFGHERTVEAFVVITRLFICDLPEQIDSFISHLQTGSHSAIFSYHKLIV